jgi:outer membrane immunogenic protein
MKILCRLVVALVAGGLCAVSSYAGPAPIAPAKEIAPMPPPSCDWNGFYLGLNAGGEFGHSEDKDLDNYNFPDRPWGYGESSFVGGEQAGYNFQWGWLVLGPEVDVGYMDLSGSKLEPGYPYDTVGKSNSDVYTTFRGRIGIALNCWLFYATGGGIGANYRTRVVDVSRTMEGPDSIYAEKQDFDFGYTAGGGVERMFNFWGRRWSFKVEYLYFDLGSQTFSGLSANDGIYSWRGETAGHIVRGGLNFHF